MLKRKLWRDIKGNYGAYLACASVLVIGLMMYVSLAVTLDKLVEKRDEYYNDYRFAEGFARITAGPEGLADDVAGIKGVDRAYGRLVQDVFVNKAKGEENTTLRLISFTGSKGELNGFRMETGKLPAGDRLELVATPAFLKGNGYSIGDRMPLIIRGQEVVFTITGTANSPEFIYEIPSGQTLAPDPKVFGIAFVSQSTLAKILGMEGQVNDISFTLEKGTDYSAVKLPVERLLNHYGLIQLIPRKDQLSHSVLTQEIVGLEASVNTTPVIFLLVAASILYIMLRRMVEQQRGQIGILKSFGFTDREIIGHYLGYAVLIGVLGGLGGGLAGSALSYSLAGLYQQYYNIPGLEGRFSPGYILTGTVMSLVFALIAGYQGCKGVLALSPAEAMRAPAPKAGGRTRLEGIRLFWQFLNTQGRMAVRNVFRSKQRSILAILGVASAFSMIVASSAMFDSFYFLIRFQYDQVERYDIKIGLNKWVSQTEGISAAEGIQGVLRAEPLLELPATLSNKWLKKDIAIMGLPDNASLYRLMDNQDRVVDLPSDGLVISEQLAKALEAGPGEVVTVKPYLGDTRDKKVIIRKVVPMYVGLGAYMDIDALGRLVNESSPAASSILIKTAPDKLAEVRKVIQEGRNVASIHDKSKLKAQFEQLMESSQSQQLIMYSFAFIMGFAIVYNVNLISLSEREREMATLMVMGMTEGEIARVLLYEQGMLSIAAVVVGIPFGYGMLWAIVNGSGSDLYNMPLVMNPQNVLQGVAVTLAFLAAAQWKVKGKIAGLSMLNVLKQQD